MCEAYAFALCDGNTCQVNLLSNHGVTIAGICHVMGPDYLKLWLYSVFVEHVERGEYDEAERLLQLGATPVDTKTLATQKRHTVLQLLARDEKVSLFKKLLDLGEDVNAPPFHESGATALQFAAINGNFDIARMALAAGADVNTAPADQYGRTAIEGAAEWGRLDMVHYLLKAGAAIQGRNNVNYRRTVYRAWEEGHRALVDMIQSWKRERYGEEDIEIPEVIIQTMTSDELVYASEEVELRHRSSQESR
jgi:ankyrin repeat protein